VTTVLLHLQANSSLLDWPNNSVIRCRLDTRDGWYFNSDYCQC